MSDGHYCVVRDLGPVKGGKGMRHHEVILDFTVRGVVAFLKALLVRARSSKLPDLPDISQESDNRSDNRSDSAWSEQSNLRRITPRPRTLHQDLSADSELADSDQEGARALANGRQ
jgi:hypothetical protein